MAVQLRKESGKGAARRLRRAGKLPAVFYGQKTKTVPIEVSMKEMEDILAKEHGGSTFMNLSFEGEKGGQKLAILKDLQVHPVTDKLIHADFYELLEGQKVTASVPVRFTGKAIGVEMGGLLQHVRRELEVRCLPKDFPEYIDIDVTELEIGDSIHIDAVALPEAVEVPHDVNFTVAVVVGRMAEAVEEVVEEEAEEAEGEGEGEAAETKEAAE